VKPFKLLKQTIENSKEHKNPPPVFKSKKYSNSQRDKRRKMMLRSLQKKIYPLKRKTFKGRMLTTQILTKSNLLNRSIVKTPKRNLNNSMSTQKDILKHKDFSKNLEYLVISNNFSISNNKSQTDEKARSFPKPLIDGKVVSMLRRIGTTISRENDDNVYPPIMSPTKKKSTWSRNLSEGEILLNFDNALTEILPNLQKNDIELYNIISLKKQPTLSKRLRFVHE